MRSATEARWSTSVHSTITPPSSSRVSVNSGPPARHTCSSVTVPVYKLPSCRGALLSIRAVF